MGTLQKILKHRKNTLFFLLLTGIASAILAGQLKKVLYILQDKLPYYFLSGSDQWMDKFVEDFFLDSTMVYTVLGSKPMSSKAIITASTDEWLKAYEPFLQLCPEEKKEESIIKAKEEIRNYDLDRNWNKWQSVRKKVGHPNFLYRVTPTENPNVKMVDLLNLEKAREVLKSHYQLFAKVLEDNFDIDSTLNEFENTNSEFWKLVFSSHLLTGLLYGFGEENSTFFDLEMKFDDRNNFLSVFFKKNEYFELFFDDNFDSILKTPTFKSYKKYLLEDPVFREFIVERRKIELVMKNGDLKEALLNKLLVLDKSNSQKTKDKNLYRK